MRDKRKQLPALRQESPSPNGVKIRPLLQCKSGTMAILDRYYHVIEREQKYVSPFWKCTHILIFFLSFASGLINAYAFSSLLHGFGYNCVLFAKISFDSEQIVEKQNSSVYKAMDFINTEWGSQKLCDFCLFSKITVFICAFIWATFFIINPRGGKGGVEVGLSPPWQIVFPALITTGIVVVLLMVVVERIYNGAKVFCEQFAPILNQTTCSPHVNVYTLEFNDKMENVFLYMSIAEYTNYLNLIFWVAQFLLLFVRFAFGIDFRILIVTISDVDESGVKWRTGEEEEEEEIAQTQI